MMYTDSDRVVALAAVFQSARLARDIARKGMCDAEALTATTNSLFIFDSDATEDVFGGIQGIRHGLRTLINQLEASTERDIEIAQYFVAITHLADKIGKNTILMDTLSSSLSPIAERTKDFDLPANTLYTQVAGIYQDNISELSPPIMVKGEPLHLQNPENAARIRSALLGGIRAAILWRQVGGKKTHLLFKRRKLATIARNLLEQVSF